MVVSIKFYLIGRPLLNATDPVISSKELLFILENQCYGVEYQPIISTENLTVFGYEALSRFYNSQHQLLAPDLVYNALHHNPLSLFQVEFAQKKLQLSHAPKHVRLFVNLDQDSYFAYDDGQADSDYNPFVELFLQHQDNELVVELIENSEVNDAKMSIEMIKLLAQKNIKTALDDICNEHSMLSSAVLEQVDFMKFDRHVVTHRNNLNFMILVQALVGYSKAAGKQTILEGIETPDDLTFARELGVDYVQGFLFKEQFVKFIPSLGTS